MKHRLEILQSKSIIEGLIRRHKYGSKFMMELKSGTTLHNSNASFFSLLTFPNVVVSRFEERIEIPRVGDIWIPKAYAYFSQLLYQIQHTKN